MPGGKGTRLRDGLTRRASLGALVSAAAGAGAAAPAYGTTANGAQGAVSLYAADRRQLSRWDRGHGPTHLLEEGREGFFRWQPSDFAEAVRVDTQQAIHIPGHDDPTGARGAWTRIVDDAIHLSWFGAKFDVGKVDSLSEASDDSDAWEAALAYLNFIGGGTLHLPHGASKVTREITVPYDGIRIVGTGMRKIYPGRFVSGSTCPSTLVPVHGGRNAIRFITKKAGGGSFCAENFNLATVETGERPEAAFGWETHHAFLYGFTFRRVGIHGFTSAFDSYKAAGTENAVGAVLIDDCVINRNAWIARSLDQTQFNGFRFTNNKAGQNGYQPGRGGIAISGHDIAIENNILEGMRDPVFVFGAYRDISIKGNYFEANVGNACVQLRDIRGPYSVGPNNYGILDYNKIDHKVLLKFCGLGNCIDPYWPYVVHKLPAPLTGAVPPCSLKNEIDSSVHGFCRLDRLDGANWAMPPRAIRSAVVSAGEVERDINPQTGFAMPVQTYRTSGAGYAVHRCAISGSAGEWVIMSWLFKHLPDGRDLATPYVSMKINGGASGGSRDYAAYGFTQAWRDGEWCLMTAALRLQIAMSSLQLLLYPHGTEADEGRMTHYLQPTVYTAADVMDIVPFVDNQLGRSVAKAPATGKWLTGDVLYNSTPTAEATLFVCTKSGAPGTWTVT